MQITSLSTDATVLTELGIRLARARIEHALTQRQLADEAGISVATVKRLESGSAVGSDTLVRYLRAVGQLGAIERLAPDSPPRPLEQLTYPDDRRRRVRHGDAVKHADGPWEWADEAVRKPGGA